MIPQTEIKPGQRVRCELTGIDGLVSSLCLEANGNIRIGIQPKCHENKMVESFFTDEASVSVLDGGISSKGLPLQDSVLSINQEVQDQLSDFSGTITALVWYMNGCVHALITSHGLERGKPVVINLPTTRLIAKGEPRPSEVQKPLSRPPGGPITTYGANR